MKKFILRVLILICGLNVFTACYGMPPGDWPEPVPFPEEESQDKTPAQSDADHNLEEAEENLIMP